MPETETTNIAYEQLFKLPEESRLTHAIWTTMTLDPREQLKMIACAHQMSKLTVCEELHPLLRGDIGRFWFFHDPEKTDQQYGALNADPELVMMLHAMQCEVRRNDGVFHPKIILVRYELDSKAHYRLQVSSRNLTVSDVFEVGAQLEGRQCEQGQRPNHNLCAFLTMLANCLPDDAKRSFDLMIDELNALCFDLPDHPDRKIAITVSGLTDGQNQARAGQDPALTCPWERENMGGTQRLHILSPDYETGQAQFKQHMIYAPYAPTEHTHAKLYFLPKADKDESDIVWLGSCNSSAAAMTGKNVECMVRIEGDFTNEVYRKDGGLSVFGTMCRRICQSKTEDNDQKYTMISHLREIIHAMTISGKDGLDQKGRRKANLTVTIQNGVQTGQSETLTCIPLGMQETAQNQSKWKSIRTGGSTKFVFVGRKNETPNGMLRIRLSSDGDDAEQLVVFDAKARQDALNGGSSVQHRDFLEYPWLERLGEAEDLYDAANEKAIFLAGLEAAKKREETEDRRRYYDEMGRVYNSIYDSLFSGQADPDQNEQKEVDA